MPEGRKIEFTSGISLSEILRNAGVFIENACGGRGLCGKCRVRLMSGDKGERGTSLACLVVPSGDITIELEQTERKPVILSKGHVPVKDFDPDPVAGEAKYGVAIDLGTTTVVCSLVDMKKGSEMGIASEVNAQKSFGLDILTRITYEIEHPEDGAANLRKAIVDSINSMVQGLCDSCSISTDDISEYAVSANCTMLHMLLGVDARPIGTAPFVPLFTEAKEVMADSIGLNAAPGARLYCLPSVSAYIGADIVAGAYVCDLKNESGNVLFIDIGTNGEIVLSANGKLISCSCAAGPALEGMNISSGMRASEGAIEDISLTEDGISLKVIGDTGPAGICGSGILAVTRELLRTGIVRSSGAFIKPAKLGADDYRTRYIHVDEKGRRSFMLTESGASICVTQADIRQVQLAKAAILSGFTALMRQAGISTEDLDKVLIAGQFGANLPAESITGTGILPPEAADRIRYVGNTSMTGAYMALISSRVRREMEELAREIEYMELGATDDYETLLSECMMFPGV